jgi:hypothetical protein
MKEAQNTRNINISNASIGNTVKKNMTGKEDKAPETDGF